MKRFLRLISEDDCFPIWLVIFGLSFLAVLALPYLQTVVLNSRADHVVVSVYE